MVLRYPFVTEKAMMMPENQNKPPFVGESNAPKNQIKREIERAFAQEVSHVSTMMAMDGRKKAVISFANEKAAEEILSRLGIM